MRRAALPTAAVLLAALGACQGLFPDAGRQAPDGAIWAEQTIEHEYPPAGYAAVLAWAQAVTGSPTHDTSDPATVEVDWWELVEHRADGTRVIVFREDYGDALPRPLLQGVEGGVFVRSPRWFATNDATAPETTVVADGHLTVACNRRPDGITHWWTRRVAVTPGSRYSQRMSARISGDAWLQLGGDWWRGLTTEYNGYSEDCTTSNNCESYVSDWYSVESSGGQAVVITAPLPPW